MKAASVAFVLRLKFYEALDSAKAPHLIIISACLLILRKGLFTVATTQFSDLYSLGD